MSRLWVYVVWMGIRGGIIASSSSRKKRSVTTREKPYPTQGESRRDWRRFVPKGCDARQNRQVLECEPNRKKNRVGVCVCVVGKKKGGGGKKP